METPKLRQTAELREEWQKTKICRQDAPLIKTPVPETAVKVELGEKRETAEGRHHEHCSVFVPRVHLSADSQLELERETSDMTHHPRVLVEEFS